MSSCMKVPKASIPNVNPTVQLRASGTGTAFAQVISFFPFLVYVHNFMPKILEEQCCSRSVSGS